MALHRQVLVELEKFPMALGKDTFVSCLYTHEELGVPFCFQVQVRSLQNVKDLTSMLNTPVAIKVSTDEGKFPRYFQGIIASACIDGWKGRHTVYEFELRPTFWLLGKTRNSRVFQNKGATDIIKAVFKENGFSDFKLQATGAPAKLEYCVQYDESDLDFVTRLMQENGLYYYFTFTKSAHSMVITDAGSTHKPLVPSPSLPYLFEAGTRKDQCVRYFRYQESVQTGKFTMNDFDYLKPKVNLKVTKAASGTQSVSKAEHYEYPGLYDSAGVGQKRLKLRMEQAEAEQAMASGLCDVTNMLCGATFKLTDHPVSKLNQEFLVTRLVVSVTNEDGGPLGEVIDERSEDLVFDAEFDCLPTKVQFRCQSTLGRPVIHGTQTAKVTGPKGEEIWTDKYGRITVQFHWDREGKNDQNSSCWVRVGQVWAGKKIGAFYIPRVGDEVLVSFIDGDPDRPIVIGSAYNADNMPPVPLPAKSTQSGVKTKSSKKGGAANCNQILLDDKKGSEMIDIMAEKDFMLEVKGDQKVTIKKTVTESVEKDVTRKIKGKVTEEVTGEAKQTYKAKLTQDIGADLMQKAKGKVTLDAAKDLSAQSKGSLTLKGAKEVTLSAGSAKVTMTKSGDVTIQAKNVTVKGSGQVVVKGAKVKVN